MGKHIIEEVKKLWNKKVQTDNFVWLKFIEKILFSFFFLEVAINSYNRELNTHAGNTERINLDINFKTPSFSKYISMHESC